MAKKEIKKVEETAIDQPLSKTEQFLQEKDNQKKIVYGFIALILIVAVIFGWRWMSQRNNEKAQNEIWSSELLFDQGQYEQALEGFEAVIEEFGSTRVGNTAKAYAGLCQKNLGNYEEAIKYLQDFDGNDNVIAPAILSALGDCYVDQETPPLQQRFRDVQQDAYYAPAVAWAVGRGVTNGMSETLFGPDAVCTRGQVVTFLWRAKGCPEPKRTANPFADVAAGAYYCKAVLWAVENGITDGASPTTFCPEAPCTRAHVVTFLWRAKGMPAARGSSPFADVPAGTYYTSAVIWAVSQGITDGTSDRAFSPDADCTRGQIVTFLFRAQQ